MIDDRLSPAPKLDGKFIKKYGFQYFNSGENHDYLADEMLGLRTEEEAAFLAAGQTAFQLLREAAKTVVSSPRLLALFGIPAHCHDLLRWSVEHEWDDYLVGRFDFAGGLDGLPIKLLEFNADTCSLMVETAFLQPRLLQDTKKNGLKNDLLTSLTGRLRTLGREQNLLLTDLGFAEDQLTASVLGRAARQAGWEDVGSASLESVIFDPDDAVLQNLGNGQAKAYDNVYKAFPWDFVAFEEPELWEILTELITHRRVKIWNPAWSMLLQAKGILAVAYEQNPRHPLLLETNWSASTLRARQYVSKPIWGRMGENVSVFHSPNYPTATTQGDFAGGPMIYQELAHFAKDREDYRYQLSTFYTDHSCATVARRQADEILDDDAEFVALFRA
jgi:glutathionylspermidine synthase